MIRLIAVVALAAVAAFGLTTTVGAKGNKTGKRAGKGKVLKANLKGKAEVPGPGDPDGKGKALVRVNPSKGRVCFRLSWKRIAEPTRAHIHKGPKGVAGPIVVPFFEGTAVKKDCVEGLDETLLRDIRSNPREYYVNVHNADFPAGAIRGQLKRSGKHRGKFKSKSKRRSGSVRG
jgi:hypothetical protein